VIQKFYIPRSLSVHTHKLFVARRSFVFVVAREHALYAHADGLGALDGAPSLVPQEIETYYPVRIDVWVHGDWTAWSIHKGDFWRLLICLLDDRLESDEGRWQQGFTYGVGFGEGKFQLVNISIIQRVVIQDANIKEPLLQVVAIHELDARR
jgi:hypothetical protein